MLKVQRCSLLGGGGGGWVVWSGCVGVVGVPFYFTLKPWKCYSFKGVTFNCFFCFVFVRLGGGGCSTIMKPWQW